MDYKKVFELGAATHTATHATHATMSEALVSVLPTQLAFARLLKTNLSRCSGGLLRILFGEDRELAFFNMTESPHEVSLVLDELSMAALRDECGAGVVEVEKNRWRAIMLCEGSDGFQQTGVVERLTGPLAAAGISLFNLSTYEADFILVREADLERTVLCLQRLFRCQIEGFDVKEGGGGGSVEEGVRSSPPASAGETKDTIGGGGGALGSAAALADKTAACGLEDEAGTAAGSGEGGVAAEPLRIQGVLADAFRGADGEKPASCECREPGPAELQPQG